MEGSQIIPEEPVILPTIHSLRRCEWAETVQQEHTQKHMKGRAYIE